MQFMIEFLSVPQSIQEVRLCFLSVVYALYLKSFPFLDYAEYNPSSRSVRKGRNRFPHIFGKFVLGGFHFKVVPFYISQLK